MAENHELNPGELFAGRFEIESLLGEGGMGLVYLARQRELGRRVALKLLAGHVNDPSAEARFRREAQTASRIQHPNVVSIFDFGMSEDGRLYLSMELVDGITLAELIARERVIDLPRALDVLEQVVDALRAAHAAGVVHRDLKPKNIMLVERAGPEGRDLVKVLDFGLARFLDATRTALTAQGIVFGTAEYMAPERCLDQAGDARADIYSVGIIGFEMLVGRAPFTGRVVDTLQAQISTPPPAPSAVAHYPIPPEVDELLLRCLAKRPEDRFASAGELAAAIRGLYEQEATATFLDLSRTLPLAEADPEDEVTADGPLAPARSARLLAEETEPELGGALALIELGWSLGRLGLTGSELARDVLALGHALAIVLDAEAARQEGTSDAIAEALEQLASEEARLRLRLAEARALAISEGLDALVRRARV